jgi:hypothetical protein
MHLNDLLTTDRARCAGAFDLFGKLDLIEVRHIRVDRHHAL